MATVKTVIDVVTGGTGRRFRSGKALARVVDLVAGKLDRDLAFLQARADAPRRGAKVEAYTRIRLTMALEEALDGDPGFAEELRRAVAEVERPLFRAPFAFSPPGWKAKVFLSAGWRDDDDRLLLHPVKRKDDPLDVLAALAGNGHRIPVIGATVRNVGRSDLCVSAVFLTGSTPGGSLIPAVSGIWPVLPRTVKPGDSADWCLDTAEVKAVCEKWGLGARDASVGLRVAFQDGRAAPARRKVKVEELRRIWNVTREDVVRAT